MKLTKLTIATIASAVMIFGGAAPAMAYPVGTDTQLVLSQTSAIRAGKVIKVKAKNVDRDCEVVFSVEGRGNDNEDYDIASAFSGANYSTPYTGIAVPETAGEYKIQADFESGCKAEVSGAAKSTLSTVFQVGKVAVLSTPTFTSTQTLIAKKPTLRFTGTLGLRSTLTGSSVAFAKQKVSIVVTVVSTSGVTKTLTPTVVTTTSTGTFSGSKALSTKDLKGTYTVKATYTSTSKTLYSSATSSTSSEISINAVKAKIAAQKAAALKAKAAKLAAAKHVANINKLTR